MLDVSDVESSGGIRTLEITQANADYHPTISIMEAVVATLSFSPEIIFLIVISW